MTSILPEHLEGYGVTLRRWRADDVELLHRAVDESYAHLRPWMDWVAQEPLSVEQRRAMLRRWEEDWRAGGDIIYGTMIDEARVAGGCGLHHRRGPGVLEIGYWTHPAHLRRGIATAAALLLTDAAFALPDIEFVEIHQDRANTASRGVPRRLGYELVEERPDARAAPAEVGIDCTWRIDREGWAAAAESRNAILRSPSSRPEVNPQEPQ
ncbi:MAG TPA: GNAT family protein [Solirubrobacteraceae bacterium]|nr:GNAT family protein [Solirubrobacteraceae bacterium]